MKSRYRSGEPELGTTCPPARDTQEHVITTPRHGRTHARRIPTPDGMPDENKRDDGGVAWRGSDGSSECPQVAVARTRDRYSVVRAEPSKAIRGGHGVVLYARPCFANVDFALGFVSYAKLTMESIGLYVRNKPASLPGAVGSVGSVAPSISQPRPRPGQGGKDADSRGTLASANAGAGPKIPATVPFPSSSPQRPSQPPPQQSGYSMYHSSLPDHSIMT